MIPTCISAAVPGTSLRLVRIRPPVNIRLIQFCPADEDLPVHMEAVLITPGPSLRLRRSACVYMPDRRHRFPHSKQRIEKIRHFSPATVATAFLISPVVIRSVAEKQLSVCPRRFSA